MGKPLETDHVMPAAHAHQGLFVLCLPQHVPVLSEQPPPLALAQLLVPLVAPDLQGMAMGLRVAGSELYYRQLGNRSSLALNDTT